MKILLFFVSFFCLFFSEISTACEVSAFASDKQLYQASDESISSMVVTFEVSGVSCSEIKYCVGYLRWWIAYKNTNGDELTKEGVPMRYSLRDDKDYEFEGKAAIDLSSNPAIEIINIEVSPELSCR